MGRGRHLPRWAGEVRTKAAGVVLTRPWSPSPPQSLGSERLSLLSSGAQQSPHSSSGLSALPHCMPTARAGGEGVLSGHPPSSHRQGAAPGAENVSGPAPCVARVALSSHPSQALVAWVLIVLKVMGQEGGIRPSGGRCPRA